MITLDPKVKAALEETRRKLEAAGEIWPRAKLDEIRGRFRARFGLERLRALDGEALLEEMHGRGTKDSLVHWLEFKHDEDFPGRTFGGIGGGSAYKFGFFKNAKTGAWTDWHQGKARTLSVEEAVQRARQHREQLQRGAELIGALPPTADDAAYVRLQLDLEAAAPDLVDTAWGHKYFALQFPDVLDDFHVREYQDWNLIQMLIEPAGEPGRFVSAGRFAASARALGFSIWELRLVRLRDHGGAQEGEVHVLPLHAHARPLRRAADPGGGARGADRRAPPVPRARGRAHRGRAERVRPDASRNAGERAGKLRGYIDAAYEDKLDGRIPAAMWEAKSRAWNDELGAIERRLAASPSEEGDPQHAIRALELSKELPRLWVAKEQQMRRSVVEIAYSNSLLRDRTLVPHWRSPFDMISKGPELEGWSGQAVPA